MGKESTINTYEGHVFYFTEKGNKNKEFARYTMEKEHVSEKNYYIITFILCKSILYNY
jgi:hypothetical protein